MTEFFTKGGPVLWFIVALSALAVLIIIERLVYFRRIATDEKKLYERVGSSIRKGHFEEALAICDQNLSPFATLLKTGIENRHYAESVQRDLLKDAAAQEVPGLERFVSALGTIANIAPLIGLLGTVTGTMRSLGVLGRFGAVSDPTVIASGVSEALINTVAGIIVAVFSVIFYNYLVNKVNLIVLKLESHVSGLLAMVNAGGPAGGGK